MALGIADVERVDVAPGVVAVPGSKARNERKSLAITPFKSIARQVWP